MDGRGSRITDAQVDIFKHSAYGKLYAQVAREMGGGTTEGMVKYHMRAASASFGVPNRTATIVCAYRLGFFRLDQPVAEDAELPAWGQFRVGRNYRLTAREIEILLLCAQGLPAKAVGKRLYLTEHTVKTHMHKASIMCGTQHRTTIATIMSAVQMGCLTLRTVPWPTWMWETRAQMTPLGRQIRALHAERYAVSLLGDTRATDPQG